MKPAYSEWLAENVYNEGQRQQKARKVLAVLSDWFDGHLETKRVLDLGCSAGIMTNYMAHRFQWIIGTDIDPGAVRFALDHRQSNSDYAMADALYLPFRDESFDILLCAHVYEHVTNARKMMGEIHRVLRPQGICFFAAGNRLRWMEPHYRLPMLSVLPKTVAHRYLQLLRRGDTYDENHLTYWELKRLVRPFRLIDYTGRIIDDPEKFAATDVCRSGSLKQAAGRIAYRAACWLMPTYVFLLQKR